MTDLRELPDFVPDFGTRIDRTVYRGVEHEHAYYDPPYTGVHLCGEGAFEASATAWRMDLDEPRARQLWESMREVAECGKDEADFVADLCVDGDVVADFYTNRQLWSAALRARHTHSGTN